MPAADPPRRTAPRGALLLAGALAVQLGVAGVTLADRTRGTGAEAAYPAVTAAAAGTTAASPAPSSPASSSPASRVVPAAPVRVTAAALWAGTLVAVPLAVDRGGALGVPRTAGEVGWWAAGPRPGDTGAAVLVGHVDLDGRPGVFARLAGARPGTAIVVDAGRGERRFVVTEVRRYPKERFPADVVYEPTGSRELRLITCGGRFDRRTGHYVDNVVVTAVAA